MKIFSKTNGVSAIAALLTLMSLAAMGVVISYLAAAGAESRANHLLSTKAFYTAQAGIEYAVKKIYEGETEIVPLPGKAFGPGTFTVSRTGKTLTVMAAVGNTIRTHKVDSPTHADCTVIDTSNSSLNGSGEKIQQTYFRKICLTQIVVDKMQFDWVTDNEERLEKIQIQSVTAYDNPAGAPSGTLLDIADFTAITGGNNVINSIDFDSDVEGKMMTMTWTFGDTSTKSVTFGPLAK